MRHLLVIATPASHCDTCCWDEVRSQGNDVVPPRHLSTTRRRRRVKRGSRLLACASATNCVVPNGTRTVRRLRATRFAGGRRGAIIPSLFQGRERFPTGGLSFNWHVYACGPLFRCQASIAIVGTYRPAIVWPGSARLWLVVGRDFCLASGGYHHQGLAER